MKIFLEEALWAALVTCVLGFAVYCFWEINQDTMIFRAWTY